MFQILILFICKLFITQKELSNRLVLLWISIVPAYSDVLLTSPFTDNMILQRNQKVPIWGKADPGEIITIEFNNQIKTTSADSEGKWKIYLDPMLGGGPFNMIVEGNNKVFLNNILLGEVWLAIGQSNMVQPLGKNYNPANEIPDSDKFRYIDFTTSGTKPNYKPGNWKLSKPENAADFSAVASFYAIELYKTLGVPVGIVECAIGATSLESWMDRQTVSEINQLTWGKTFGTGDDVVGSNHKFLAKAVEYGIAGAIWYQGENAGNNGSYSTYKEHLGKFIGGLRRIWNQGDFPFYIVQLTNYREKQPHPNEVGLWPRVREAQRLSLDVKNTGLAVTIDIGEANDIHPVNKKDIGKRLVLNARALHYGEISLVYSGPTFKSYTKKGNSFRIHFTHTGKGLVSNSGDNLKGFSITNGNGTYYWANAVIDGDDVVVSSSRIQNPTAVRYAWADNPVISLFNQEGLPAGPFNTKNQMPNILFGCTDSTFEEYDEKVNINDGSCKTPLEVLNNKIGNPNTYIEKIQSNLINSKAYNLLGKVIVNGDDVRINQMEIRTDFLVPGKYILQNSSNKEQINTD